MDISFWGSPFNPLHHVKERRKEFLDRAQITESLGGVGGQAGSGNGMEYRTQSSGGRVRAEVSWEAICWSHRACMPASSLDCALKAMNRLCMILI